MTDKAKTRFMATAIRQFLLKGDDFLLKRHLDRLLKELVDPGLKDFNFERVSAARLEPGALKEKLLTQPIMADFRTLVVEDFEAVEKEALDELADVIGRQDLPSHVILIAAKIDKRTRFYKAFTAAGEVHEFKKLYPNQIPGVLVNEAKAMRVEFEPGAAELLVEVAGTDLLSLTGEISKLALYLHPETRITRRIVRELVGQGLVDNVFQLGNLVGQRRAAEACHLFRRMTEQGEAEVRILSLLIGHFRKLFLARELKERRSPEPLAGVLGVSPYFARDYEAQAARFSLPELRGIYRGLMRLSEELRSSRLNRTLLFENFLQSVTLRHPAPAGK